jgi:hypothetical protein
MGAQQVAPATIYNHFFKLIDAWASERELFAPYIFENALTYANNQIMWEHGLTQPLF